MDLKKLLNNFINQGDVYVNYIFFKKMHNHH